MAGQVGAQPAGVRPEGGIAEHALDRRANRRGRASPGAMRMPAPASATRQAFSGWSQAIGTITSGTSGAERRQHRAGAPSGHNDVGARERGGCAARTARSGVRGLAPQLEIRGIAVRAGGGNHLNRQRRQSVERGPQQDGGFECIVPSVT